MLLLEVVHKNCRGNHRKLLPAAVAKCLSQIINFHVVGDDVRMVMEGIWHPVVVGSQASPSSPLQEPLNQKHHVTTDTCMVAAHG